MEKYRSREKFENVNFLGLVQYRLLPSVSGPDVTHTSSESVPDVNTRSSISWQVGSTCKHLLFNSYTSRVQVCNTRAAVDKVSWLGLVRLDSRKHWPTPAFQS